MGMIEVRRTEGEYRTEYKIYLIIVIRIIEC
jgi:hypothetical protein